MKWNLKDQDMHLTYFRNCDEDLVHFLHCSKSDLCCDTKGLFSYFDIETNPDKWRLLIDSSFMEYTMEIDSSFMEHKMEINSSLKKFESHFNTQ